MGKKQKLKRKLYSYIYRRIVICYLYIPGKRLTYYTQKEFHTHNFFHGQRRANIASIIYLRIKKVISK